MKAPVVIVNFKAYAEAEGRRCISLAKTCQKVSRESGVPIAVCPPHLWAAGIAEVGEIPVYAQSVDPRPAGAATGWITPSMLHSSAIKGTLVNHSEHRIPRDDIAKAVSMCRDLKLETCVCTKDADESEDLASLRPDMIAVEPPDLIGGDVSVTTADPGVVSGTVDRVHAVDRDIRVYCGAGVKTGDDVKAALDLGAYGVLLASGVVKAKDPEAALRGLISKI